MYQENSKLCANMSEKTKIKDSPRTRGEDVGAPLVCFLLCTKLLSQQMHRDIKIHFFALITKTTMTIPKKFIARRHLDAMCPNSNLITKICENIENLAQFACEKCLYNSIFALPIDHAKMLKTSILEALRPL